jgi:hypothetical protein
VLYIHGGGWMAGHTRHSGAFADWPKVLAALAAEGFTVASLEYRLSGEAKFPPSCRMPTPRCASCAGMPRNTASTRRAWRSGVVRPAVTSPR